MKKYLLFHLAFVLPLFTAAQEILHLQHGASVTIQNGVELTLMGGIGLDNGSSLINNGTLRLKNNSVANQSDWTDNSGLGALSGTGLVIFNSTHNQNFVGATQFYAVRMDAAALSLQSDFSISNTLHLTKGPINTASYYLSLNNDNPSSLLNDVSNTAYANSWINGNFRRLITDNTSVYDFPVGNDTRCNLLQFLNNNISGTNYLTASFGPKPGNDEGLNVVENSAIYEAINNEGVWYLVPDVSPSVGSYALQLYFNGFSGLTDNRFGILRRDDASSNGADWTVPAESSLEADNGLGRKLSDGFARRKNISTFSQWGIGQMQHATAPTVTIAQSVGQSDPTSVSPIRFTATFSENVNGFDASDISFAGSTAASLSAVVTGGPAVFDVAISGMTSSGLVVATIPAGAAVNAASISNLASTNIDNTVTYNLSSPPAGLPVISVSDATVYESEGIAVLTVSLSHITTLAVKTKYATTDGTAVSSKKEKDYKSDNGSITIPPGTLNTTISIPIYNDGKRENIEYFYVNLTKPTNGTLGDVTAIVNIFDGGTSSSARLATRGDAESLLKETQFNVKVYPNPSQSDFVVEIISDDNGSAKVRVVNSAGQVIENFSSDNKPVRMGLEWNPGLYIVDVVQGTKRKTIKLIKY